MIENDWNELNWTLTNKKDDKFTDGETLFDLLLTNVEKRESIVKTVKTAATKRQIDDETASLVNSKLIINEDEKLSFNVLFDTLLKLLVKESWPSESSVCRSVKRAKGGVISKQDWKISSKVLRTAMKEVRPFNFSKMFELYDLTEKESKQVENEDIVLLLGHTGAGKSTTIHFLAGAQMDYDKKTGHIYPKTTPISQLRNIRIEFKMAESVTRFISAVPMNLAESNIFIKRKNKIILCDSPGFDDSAGAEVDVANGLGIVKAVENAKSVKILLAIGYGDIDQARMKGIKNVAVNLSNIVPNYQDFLEDGSIQVFFTKLKDEHRNESMVKEWISQGLTDMTENDDTGPAFELLQHILEQEPLIMLHPVKDDRKKTLKQFFSNKRKQNEWIENPSDEFKSFVSKSSQDSIQQQILRHKEAITHACEQQPFEHHVAIHKLKQLSRVRELLPSLPSVDDGFKQSVEIVVQKWNARCTTLMDNLKKSVNERSVNEFNNAALNYSQILIESKEIDVMVLEIDEMKSKDIIASDRLNETLNQQFNTLLLQCRLNKKSKTYFDKCGICLKYFKVKFEPLYQDKIKQLTVKIKDIETKIKESIDNNLFNQTHLNLVKLNDAMQSGLPFFDDTDNLERNLDDIVNECTNYLIDHAEEHVNKVKSIFRPIKELSKASLIASESLTEAKTSIEILQDAADKLKVSSTSRMCDTYDEIDTMYTDCCDIVVEYCEKIVPKINEKHLVYSTMSSVSRRTSFRSGSGSIISGGSSGKSISDTKGSNLKLQRKSVVGRQNSLETMKPFVEQFAQIRKINLKIKNETTQAFFQMIERLKGYLQRIEYLFKKTIDEIEHDPLGADYKELVNYVRILQSANWVFSLQSDDSGKSDDTMISSNEYVKRIENKLEEYMDNMVDETERLFVTLDDPTSVDSVRELVEGLNKMKILDTLLPQLRDTSGHIMGILRNDIHQVLQKIQKDFKLKSHNDVHIQYQTKLLESYCAELKTCLPLLTIKKKFSDYDMKEDKLSDRTHSEASTSLVTSIVTKPLPIGVIDPAVSDPSASTPPTRLMTTRDAITLCRDNLEKCRLLLHKFKQATQKRQQTLQDYLSWYQETDKKMIRAASYSHNSNPKSRQMTNDWRHHAHDEYNTFDNKYNDNHIHKYKKTNGNQHVQGSGGRGATNPSGTSYRLSDQQQQILKKRTRFTTWDDLKNAIRSTQLEIELVNEQATEDENEYNTQMEKFRANISYLTKYQAVEAELKSKGFHNHQIEQWKKNISSLETEIAKRQASLNVFPGLGPMKRSTSNYASSLRSLDLKISDRALTFVEKCFTIPLKRHIKHRPGNRRSHDTKREHESIIIELGDDEKIDLKAVLKSSSDSDSDDDRDDDSGFNLLREIKETQNDLRTCFREYNNSCHIEMEKSFKFLINIRESDGKGYTISQHGCSLEHYMIELRNIRNKYPIIMKYMTDDDDIVQPWVEKIRNKHREFEGELEYLANLKDATLQIGVHHAKALGKLDLMMKEETKSESYGFNKLYLKYMSRIGGNQDDMKEFSQNLKDENYIAVGEDMKEFATKLKVARTLKDKLLIEGIYKKAQMLLCRAMASMYDEAKVKMLQLPSDVQSDQIAQIRKIFQLIDEANVHCKEYITPNVKKNCVESEKAAHRHLTKWVSSILHGIKVGIDTRQFESVETKIAAIKDILEILGALVDPQGTLKQKVEDAEKRIKYKMQSIVEDYQKINLNESEYSPYNHRPPKDLYKELSKVMDKRGIYNESWQQIDKDIGDKFRRQLQRAQRLGGVEAIRVLRVCKSILAALPPTTHDALKSQYDNCEEDVKAKGEQDRKIIQELITADNIKELQRQYNQKLASYEAYGKSDSTNINSIKVHVVEKARQIKRNIEKNMDNLHGTQVFELFVQLEKIVSEFNGIRKASTVTRVSVSGSFMYDLHGYTSDSSDGGSSSSGYTKYKRKNHTRRGIGNHSNHSNHRMTAGYGNDISKHSILELDYILSETQGTIESHYSKQIEDIGISIMGKRDSLELVANKIDYVARVAVANYNRMNSKSTKSVTPIFSANFDVIIEAFSAQLTSYFENLSNKFESAIKEHNITKLEQFFDRMVVYDDDKNAKLLDKLKQIKRVDIDGIKTYKQRLQQCSQYLDSLRKKIQIKGLNNDETKANDNERNKYYTHLSTKLTFLFDSRRLESHLKRNTNEVFFEPCVLTIQRDILQFCKNIKEQLDKTYEDPRNEAHWQIINVNLKNLVAFKDLELVDCKITSKKNENHEFNRNVKNIKAVEQEMRETIAERINIICACANKNLNNVDKLAENLIVIAIICTSLPSFRRWLEGVMKHLIDEFQRKKPQLIIVLALRLDNTDPTWADSVKKSHKAFDGANTYKFNKSTAEQGIDYVLKHIKCQEEKEEKIDKKLLKKKFERFDSLYWKHVKKHLKQKINVKPLTGEVCSDATRLISTHSKGGILKWNRKVKDSVIDLMAGVFAIWTLLHSQSYFTATDAKDKDAYLKQPRTAQIVSIIRLLSIDDIGSNMVRNLVQIGTGEGKSLTLAVASCILALLQFDVSCACYSARLSRRDENSFKDLFSVLGVSNRIHYGTFNELCEMVINEDGNVREMVENAVLPSKIDGFVKSFSHKYTMGNHHPKILLIDEVDVFFNPDFYGNVYNPAARLNHSSIKPLTDFIWNYHQFATLDIDDVDDIKDDEKMDVVVTKGDKDDDESDDVKNARIHHGLTLAKIKKTEEYKECATAFSRSKDKLGGIDWTILLDESIKLMLSDVKTFQTTDYIVVNDKIGYKEGDGISTNATLGYNTLFTYYYEHGRGNISLKSLTNAICIYLKCGTFSYAEIPKEFHTILGVTGTLKTLSNPAKNIIHSTYGIMKHTYMPSLFGINHYTFNSSKDVKIYNIENYFEGLKEEIRKQLSIDNKLERCVLVFFEDSKKLDSFSKYHGFSLYHRKRQVLKLDETLTQDERDRVIKLSTTGGRITLCTKSFGRGTDFQVNDRIVKNNGGPHVITTFISEEQSEEVQIKGRTARQGGDGSFSMILRENELEKYKITKLEFEHVQTHNPDQLYRLINEKRNSFFEIQYKNDTSYVNKAKESHKEAQQLVNALKSNNVSTVRDILWKRNRGPSEYDLVTKIGILMDATGSMSHLIQNAKNTVEEMFRRISSILESKDIDPQCFQIQFIAYRNYDAPPSELLRFSGWYSDATKLRTFLDQIKANYGWGTNEAVEVALQHVRLMIENNGDDVTELILIGDAGCNTKDEVNTKRERRKDEWNESKSFKNATFFLNEVQFFQSEGIKIHTCALAMYAQKDFETIAKQTGGVYQVLSIDDTSKSGEKLTDLVAQHVLNAKGGKELVTLYKQKFMHVKN